MTYNSPVCLRPVFSYSRGKLFEHKSLKTMIATSYLGSGMNSAFRNKNNFPSHPFPMFSEAVHCIHLEKETSSSSVILFRFILKEEKSYSLWVSDKSHLELWLLRVLCGWVRTTICYLGRGARTKQPREPLRSQHLSRTGTANTSKHYLPHFNR